MRMIAPAPPFTFAVAVAPVAVSSPRRSRTVGLCFDGQLLRSAYDRGVNNAPYNTANRKSVSAGASSVTVTVCATFDTRGDDNAPVRTIRHVPHPLVSRRSTARRNDDAGVVFVILAHVARRDDSARRRHDRDIPRRSVDALRQRDTVPRVGRHGRGMGAARSGATQTMICAKV